MTSNAASRRPVAIWGRWRDAILLGLATIGAYGCATYAIGVLIPVIAAEDGWSTGMLSGGFAIGVLVSGAISLAAGRIFDRRGSGPVLLPGILVGAMALGLASWAQSSWQFMAAWAVGASAVGGTAYYNLTMPMISRLYADRRAGALSVLTLFGAVASTIFYPLAGLLSEEWGWRGALRGLVLVMVLFVLPAAVWVRAPAAAVVDGASRSGLREALADPAVTRALLMFTLMAIGTSALMLHQVAAMQAAGLTLALAATLAGSRGLFQLTGRLMLAPLTRTLGLPWTMRLCYAAAATATVALLLAQGMGPAVWLIIYFSAVGGMSLGLLSPLGGLYQAEVYGDRHLGTLTGLGTVLGNVGAAAGAWLAGVMADQTGSYAFSIGGVLAVQGAAILVLLWQQRAMASRRSATAVEEQAVAS